MKLQRLVRSGTVLVICGACAFGVATLGDSALARPPGPDCGPTRSWSCALPGCPDCYEVLFIGTICEKNAFEKKTGRVCTPD